MNDVKEIDKLIDKEQRTWWIGGNMKSREDDR